MAPSVEATSVDTYENVDPHERIGLLERALEKERNDVIDAFRANALRAQSQLQDHFVELLIPLSNAQKRDVERSHRVELSAASAEYRARKNGGKRSLTKAKRVLHSRVEAAREKRKNALSQSRRDLCNNWGCHAPRLKGVLEHVCEYMPLEMMASLNEVGARAVEMLANAETLRNEGKESEARDAETKARELYQQILWQVRRMQIASSSGRSPPITRVGKSSRTKELEAALHDARQAVARTNCTAKAQTKRPFRRKPPRADIERFGFRDRKERRQHAKASYFCSMTQEASKRERTLRLIQFSKLPREQRLDIFHAALEVTPQSTSIPPGVLEVDVYDRPESHIHIDGVKQTLSGEYKTLTFGSEEGCTFRDVKEDLGVNDEMEVTNVRLTIQSMQRHLQYMLYRDQVIKDAAALKMAAVEAMHPELQAPKGCIFVEKASGGSMRVEYHPLATIGEIKSEIEERTGLSPDEYNLHILGGKMLMKETCTLADYNIQENATLTILLRVHGGNGKEVDANRAAAAAALLGWRQGQGQSRVAPPANTSGQREPIGRSHIKLELAAQRQGLSDRSRRERTTASAARDRWPPIESPPAIGRGRRGDSKAGGVMTKLMAEEE